MLTKSLHTITAATNVAKFLLQETEYVGRPENLARAALNILGYDIDTTIKGDPTVDRIVENCRTLIKENRKDIAA